MDGHSTHFETSVVRKAAEERVILFSSVIAGFRTTGVYPFDQHALQPAGSTPTRFNPAFLSERTGLNFIIPLYSPARQHSVTSSPSVATFTKDEMVRFQRRVEGV